MKIPLATLALLAASTALAQKPEFEVAVVKPATQEQLMAAIQAKQTPHVGVTIDKNRVDIGFQSLSDILARAYDVASFQIVGPDFLRTERFDILAKLPAGSTEEQVPQMLQALLADRFKLTVHRENKETGIYALVIAKGGLKKMKPATAEELAPEPQPGDRTQSTPFGKMTIRQTANGVVGFMPGIGTLKASASPGGGGEHVEMSNLTTSRFAQMLISGMDKLVVDKTGLKGSYEASFDITMDAQPMPQGGGEGGGGGAAMASAPALNPMFMAVEQLGLKLEQQKDSVEMVVVDHIEKTPTDN